MTLNYASTGSAGSPALLLVPPQASSWWSYEQAMKLLADDFEVFAVDLRGQGRSTRTPGRYTLDNMGNDLVRFISGRIRRPVIVAGNSSGGLIACCNAVPNGHASNSGHAAWRRHGGPGSAGQSAFTGA